MKVRTLIATEDINYTMRIAERICERHSDIIEISVCNTAQQLQIMLTGRRYDVTLADEKLINEITSQPEQTRLSMLLWSDSSTTQEQPAVRRIKKHSRVSAIVAQVLEEYAAVSGMYDIPGNVSGKVTAVWSPCGGSGKTTVALAYAASEAASGKDVFYLNLEPFSASSAYFNERGKSVSSVFEMLEGGEGNIAMLLSGISVCENGIRHLGNPDNFDDISILTAENVNRLIISGAGISDRLVVDLGSSCDACVRAVFEMADSVLLVTGCSDISKAKLNQFLTQSNVYESIKDKTTIVFNEVAKSETIESEDSDSGHIYLPYVPAIDARFVYKTLSKNDFRTDIHTENEQSNYENRYGKGGIYP